MDINLLTLIDLIKEYAVYQPTGITPVLRRYSDNLGQPNGAFDEEITELNLVLTYAEGFTLRIESNRTVTAEKAVPQEAAQALSAILAYVASAHRVTALEEELHKATETRDANLAGLKTHKAKYR